MREAYMAQAPQEDRSVFEALLKYWPLIVVLASAISFVVYLKSNLTNYDVRLQNLQTQVSQVQQKAEVMDASYVEVSGNIKEINAKLDFIIRKVQL